MENFGLVLCGGGAKGAYQIGALKAIAEYDISFNGFSGSSIGALNQVFYYTNSLDNLIEIWKDVDFADFFSLTEEASMLGLSTREGLIKIIDKYLDVDKIQNATKPFFVTICSDTVNKIGEYILLNGKTKEEIKTLLLASTALPIIYEPILYKGKYYLDGGIFDNSPINPLLSNNFEKIMVISCDYYYSKESSENMIIIKPSIDLKGLIEGTMNFNEEEINLRINLGYADAKRTLNNYFHIKNHTTQEFENDMILRKYRMNKIQKDVNKNIDYINKYDI